MSTAICSVAGGGAGFWRLLGGFLEIVGVFTVFRVAFGFVIKGRVVFEVFFEELEVKFAFLFYFLFIFVGSNDCLLIVVCFRGVVYSSRRRGLGWVRGGLVEGVG